MNVTTANTPSLNPPAHDGTPANPGSTSRGLQELLGLLKAVECKPNKLRQLIKDTELKHFPPHEHYQAQLAIYEAQARCYLPSNEIGIPSVQDLTDEMSKHMRSKLWTVVTALLAHVQPQHWPAHYVRWLAASANSLDRAWEALQRLVSIRNLAALQPELICAARFLGLDLFGRVAVWLEFVDPRDRANWETRNDDILHALQQVYEAAPDEEDLREALRAEAELMHQAGCRCIHFELENRSALLQLMHRIFPDSGPATPLEIKVRRLLAESEWLPLIKDDLQRYPTLAHCGLPVLEPQNPCKANARETNLGTGVTSPLRARVVNAPFTPSRHPAAARPSQAAASGQAKGNALKPLFNSPPERELYELVLRSYPNCLVYANCALQTLLSYDEIKKRLTDAEDFEYFLKASVDLAVFSDFNGNLTPLFAVEWDSSFHDNARQQARDARKDRIAQVGGLPLIRLRHSAGLATHDIREQVRIELKKLHA